MTTNMAMIDIEIEWEELTSATDIASKTGPNDYGIYQIYGKHPVHGYTLLYVGKAEEQTFATRLKQHEYWLKHEEQPRIYVGRLDPRCYKQEPDTWSDWSEKLSWSEALTIYWHSPPYNSHYIKAYTFPPLRVANRGVVGKLLPRYDSSGSFVRPDDYRLAATFTVPGGIRGEGEAEAAWKQRCRELSRAALVEAGVTMPAVSPVKIVARFRVPERAQAHDIDNMLKLLTDSIGAGGLFPRRKGATSDYDTDDGLVFAVESEKELVAADARTEVEVWVRAV